MIRTTIRCCAHAVCASLAIKFTRHHIRQRIPMYVNVELDIRRFTGHSVMHIYLILVPTVQDCAWSHEARWARNSQSFLIMCHKKHEKYLNSYVYVGRIRECV